MLMMAQSLPSSATVPLRAIAVTERSSAAYHKKISHSWLIILGSCCFSANPTVEHAAFLLPHIGRHSFADLLQHHISRAV
jgi:hypothetical protein